MDRTVVKFPGARRQPPADKQRRPYVPVDRATDRAIKRRARELSEGDREWYEAKLAELVMRGELPPDRVIYWGPEEH